MLEKLFASFWWLVGTVAIVSAVWWVLTHPAKFANAIVTVIGGVVSVVNNLVTGISGLF